MKNIPPKIFVEELSKNYPNEICHLHWDKKRPWTLLFAVILSAQCTDKRVNIVTEDLFKNFPDLESYVARPVEHIEEVIKSTGFYRNKAKNLKKCAGQLILNFNYIIPNNLKDLTTLGGVGRKTGNVILWNIYQINEGFVVDTHVGRISQRVGLTKEKNPLKIEKDLMKKIPQKKWGEMSHKLVQFGRDFCKAPTPKCDKCFLNDICPKKKFYK